MVYRLLLGALISTGAAGADQDGEHKSVQAVRIDNPPVIDGRLDDTAWQSAAVIDDIHQILPYEYEAPSEQTVFYLMYDKDNLYVGARARDSRPDQMTARVLKQGYRLNEEDRVGVVLDPFNDKRSGYQFELNPNGVRSDGLFYSPIDFAPAWDGIWQGDAVITPDGYTAEFAIPFKTLSFDADEDTWGLNVSRMVMRNAERSGWVSHNRAVNPAAAGEITGLHGMDSGMGLDIVPSASVRVDREFARPDSSYSLDRDFLCEYLKCSLDLFYKITPSLNGSLTVNTDFSATEIDDRQVNLTRFSLFFPEKRDFFLKDSDIFEFAVSGNGQPYFSRKIGLSPAGGPVDLEVGTKLSGRIGQWNLGALAIRQADYDYTDPYSGLPEHVDVSHLFVGRVTRNVLAESSAGVIMTYGDPASDLDNLLVGADFRYVNTRLGPGRTLVGQAWVQHSDTEGRSGDDYAWGVSLNMPNTNKWMGGLEVQEFQQNFNPALGFVNRPGIRHYSVHAGYRYLFTDSWLRDASIFVDAAHITRLSDEQISSQEIFFKILELQNHQGDSIEFIYDWQKEGLDAAFEISPGVVLPRGLYTWSRQGIGYHTSPARVLAVSGYYWWGDYYSGDRVGARAVVTWRPNKHLSLGGMYDTNNIDLAQGHFITRLITFNSDIVFNNTLSWTNLVQFDNISHNLGLNSRIHWNPQAGRDVYLVFNYNLSNALDVFHRSGEFRTTGSDLTLKVNYTFRF